MGQACFDVSPEKLAKVLRLPKGTRLYGVEWRYAEDCARLYVTSPDLPDKPEGVRVGYVIPHVEWQADGPNIWVWNADTS